ncbi:DUF5999 family protein [Streptomyces vinaceus]
MKRLMESAHRWWDEVLGIACNVGDITASVRSHRATKAQNELLAESPRTLALAEARRGCNHQPPCPPATAADRQQAEVVYQDEHFAYLCNGLTLSAATRSVPDYPPTDYIVPAHQEVP